MRNLFILHLSLKEPSEIIHYNETIINKVDQNKIKPYISTDEAKAIRDNFDDVSVAIWRMEDNKLNREKFDKIKHGDEILIIEEDIIRFLGKLVVKIENLELSKVLWPDYGNKKKNYALSFVIFDLIPIDLPFTELSKYFGYGENWIPDGLTLIPSEKMNSQKLQDGGLYRLLWDLKNTFYHKPLEN